MARLLHIFGNYRRFLFVFYSFFNIAVMVYPPVFACFLKRYKNVHKSGNLALIFKGCSLNYLPVINFALLYFQQNLFWY